VFQPQPSPRGQCIVSFRQACVTAVERA
jgi:hypothetical protein